MNITLAQITPKLGDIVANFKAHEQEIERAVAAGSQLIIFPELSLSGYQIKDLVQETALTRNHPLFEALCTLSRKIDILVGAPFEEPAGIYYNCAFYFADGHLLHLHKKVQLPNFGMFEEAMTFKAGDTFRAFDRHGLRIGLLICREILFPMYHYLYFLQGCDMILAISNSPYRGIAADGDYHSLKLWERMGEVSAIHFHQHFVFVNRTGFEDGVGFGGGSFYAPPGQPICQRAPYYDPHTLTITLEPDLIRRARIAGQYLRDDDPHLVLRELERILNV